MTRRATVLLLLLAVLGVLPALGAQDKPDKPKSDPKAQDPKTPDPDKKPPPEVKPPDKDREKSLATAKAAAEDPLSFDRSVRQVLQNFCYKCHNEEKKKGNVNLKKDENPRMIAENRKVWQTALEAVEKGEMPPKKEKPELSDAYRLLIVNFLKRTLGSLDCERMRDPGRPVTRRLNRTEYNNTVFDLTGLNVRPADDFSPDATGYGFDNIGEVLSISPVLIEQYHEGARKLLAELVDRKAAHPDAYRRVFFVEPGPAVPDREAARQVAERFASRAFRRPVEPAFLQKLLALYDKARARGETHEAAVRPVLLAVLISPRFFLRIEATRPGVEGSYPLDDYDLASRLSYFLWSGPPDEELLALAAKGALGATETLEAQTRRMLADPRSRALSENFIGQWLQLRGLANHKPDAKHFPQFTETLRSAMQQELSLFLEEVVKKDRPLTDLIDADYTYVNEELARHYGLPGIRGTEFRRVTLPDRRRGGVVTSAAVLTIQSDTDRNNVPRRGNYIAASILGTPPPPPPPDIPALEDSKTVGKDQTLRQLLEAHRSKPECATCHSRIDPLGFGLENFDAIGRWRDQEAGAPVDASGVLPGGRAFNGPVELKKILMERRDEFARTMAENLLIYALGRGLQLEDECVLRDAQKAAASGEYKFSTLVLAIVKSHPFRHRKNPDF